MAGVSQLTGKEASERRLFRYWGKEEAWQDHFCSGLYLNMSDSSRTATVRSYSRLERARFNSNPSVLQTPTYGLNYGQNCEKDKGQGKLHSVGFD